MFRRSKWVARQGRGDPTWWVAKGKGEGDVESWRLDLRLGMRHSPWRSARPERARGAGESSAFTFTCSLFALFAYKRCAQCTAIQLCSAHQFSILALPRPARPGLNLHPSNLRFISSPPQPAAPKSAPPTMSPSDSAPSKSHTTRPSPPSTSNAPSAAFPAAPPSTPNPNSSASPSAST